MKIKTAAIGALRKQPLTVKSVENPSHDYLVVRLEKPEGMTWVPGAIGIFSFKGERMKQKNFRTFSIASAPEENEIIIGTRWGQDPTPFKKRLRELQKGDVLWMRGPIDIRHLKEDSRPSVLFASGAGITPYRAILTSLRNQDQRVIELVATSSDFHLFGDEFLEIAEQNPKIIVHQVHGSDQARQKMTELAQKYGNDASYTIIGLPKVIRSIKGLLRDNGIYKKNYS